MRRAGSMPAHPRLPIGTVNASGKRYQIGILAPARHECLRAGLTRVGVQDSLRYQHQSNANALRAPYRAENTIRDTVDQDWFGPVLANEPISTTTFAGSLRPLTPSPHMHKHVHVDRSHVENHQSHAPSLAMVLDVMPLGVYAQRPQGPATPTSTVTHSHPSHRYTL